jgi:isopenicillin-N epimerase
MFDWPGTQDPSAWLVTADALRVVGDQLPGGWPAVMARNHSVVLRARDLLCAVLGISPPAPDEMLGAMAAVPLPDATAEGIEDGTAWADEDALADALRGRWRIEVPVFSWPAPPRRLLRVSAQLYNGIGDYERLVEALAVELGASAARKL